MRNIRKNKNTAKGRMLTSQRQLLLKLIRQAGSHISAKELYNQAAKKNESISLATVYRNLRLFKRIGLIDERRLGSLHTCYEIKDSHDHQHLICRSCGKVIEFENPIFSRIVDQVREDYGFDITKVDMYMEGYCQECNPYNVNSER